MCLGEKRGEEPLKRRSRPHAGCSGRGGSALIGVVGLGRDCPIQHDEERRRLRADLLREELAVGVELAERVGTPAGVSECSHQQTSRAVAKRIDRDERLEHRDRGGRLAGLEDHLCQLLDRTGPELCETSDLGRRPFLVRELRVGIAAPERDRRCEGVARRAVVGRARLGQERVELGRVDLVRSQRVTRWRGDERVEAHEPSQPTDRGSESAGRESEMLLESFGRNDRVRPLDQEAREAALCPTHQVDLRIAGPPQLERAQDSKLHDRRPPPGKRVRVLHTRHPCR